MLYYIRCIDLFSNTLNFLLESIVYTVFHTLRCIVDTINIIYTHTHYIHTYIYISITYVSLTHPAAHTKLITVSAVNLRSVSVHSSILRRSLQYFLYKSANSAPVTNHCAAINVAHSMLNTAASIEN